MPRHSIIRECWEEASLDPAWVAPRLRQAGVVTYHYRTDWGWLQPEVQYVYDLELPDPDNLADGEHKVIPTTNPADGEVESFELLSLEEVVQRMVAGEFKPNCALCVRFLALASRMS
jgi:8-oxo-dGTP pyrophosphatase MutT (NUDIX family)